LIPALIPSISEIKNIHFVIFGLDSNWIWTGFGVDFEWIWGGFMVDLDWILSGFGVDLENNLISFIKYKKYVCR
jgi:hypothetical protein